MHARSMAHVFVRRRLKAPVTAQFVAYDNLSRFTGGCEFTVEGDVDAQNSFGAAIRSHYIVMLSYQPETDMWQAESVFVE